MQHFILRSGSIQIYDDQHYYKSSLQVFVEISGFILNASIRGVEYYPGILHEITYLNGTKEVLANVSVEHDSYIANVTAYNSVLLSREEAEALAGFPQTLESARKIVIRQIYSYSSALSDELVSIYPIAERNKWASVILPEAKSYLATKNPGNAPNLTQQEILRTSITDILSPAFEVSLTNRVVEIIQSDADIQRAVNHYVGTRGKWVDYVNEFAIQVGETEQEAILRLFDLDWKIGWELPV